MGRRSFISMTAINRLMSASRQRAREREKAELISAQGGNQKEFPPTFSLSGVEFNIETRNAKIEILQEQTYRTVERYVTQNYVKYPIYSGWKTKTKIIKKSIKLTNAVLETLNQYDDSLICQLSSDIIVALDCEDLIPSWFLREILEQEYREKSQQLCDTFKAYADEQQAKIKSINNNIAAYRLEIPSHEKELNKYRKKQQKLISKIKNIDIKKKSILLSILTFGIRDLLYSGKRKNTLNAKLKETNSSIVKKTNSISCIKSKIEQLESEIKLIEERISKKNKEYLKDLKAERKITSDKINQIVPLPTTITIDNTFIDLKSIIGFEYEKIIGCYIIHNKENEKYYVGQSKDVMKRLKQHFHGTVPNNVIFAEDYYSTPKERRDNLFEVKIIPCETKDELDRTEKEYISRYDSFTNGYNGTNGNQ